MRKISRFYKAAIMQNLGMFIAAGLLSVLFSVEGWFPNEDMQAVVTLLYRVAFPMLIARECGKLSGDDIGAAVGMIGVLGIVSEEHCPGILVAMLVGPIAGKMSKCLFEMVREKVYSGFEMLFKNMFIGIMGVCVLFFVKLFVMPIMSEMYQVLYVILDYLTAHNMMSVLGFVVEPLKVLFLNNSLNHGILVPLGMEQIQQFGKSILFLAETNPGPGLGVLLAYWYVMKEKRKQYGSYILIEFVGGIHEVYFPIVLANPALLAAVVLGGLSGMTVFAWMDIGLVGAASPGSVLLLLGFSARGDLLGTVCGILASAIVSFIVSFWVLKRSKEQEKEPEIKMENVKPRNICFVCDAGFGSSAMAASLFRKKLRKAGMEGIDVSHASVDEIPEDVDCVFVQKNFEPHIVRHQQIAYYFLESLIDDPVYETLITDWKNP